MIHIILQSCTTEDFYVFAFIFYLVPAHTYILVEMLGLNPFYRQYQFSLQPKNKTHLMLQVKPIISVWLTNKIHETDDDDETIEIRTPLPMWVYKYSSLSGVFARCLVVVVVLRSQQQFKV